MRERCLGLPIAGVDCGSNAVDFLDDGFLFKDVVAQTESGRSKVEESGRGGEVARLVLRPLHEDGLWSRDTILWVTLEVIGRRVGPDIAAPLLRWVADKPRVATPGLSPV